MSFTSPKLSDFPYFPKNVIISEKLSKDELKPGCQKPDCIPSIDRPNWLSKGDSEAMYKSNEDLIVLLNVDNSVITETFAAPTKILDYHEIINFTSSKGVPIAITYCPLCQTAENYSRLLGTQTLELGVSGLLFNSALIIQDRNSLSLFSQVWSEGIVGRYTGKKLTKLPLLQSTVEEYFRTFPEGKILSNHTGDRQREKRYDLYPYQDYKESPNIGFPVRRTDDTLHPKTLVYTIEVANKIYIIPQDTCHDAVIQHSSSFYSKIFSGGRLFFLGSASDNKNQLDWDNWISSGISFYFTSIAYHEKTNLLVGRNSGSDHET